MSAAGSTPTPDGDNFRRGDIAAKALAAIGYTPIGETIGNEAPLPDGRSIVAFEGYPISDLIADLGHLAQRHGLSFMTLIDEGIQHYGADVIEQAWTYDDAWANELQSKTNIPNAERVLRMAGVPERYHLDIFVKVGIISPDEKDNQPS